MDNSQLPSRIRNWRWRRRRCNRAIRTSGSVRTWVRSSKRRAVKFENRHILIMSYSILDSTHYCLKLPADPRGLQPYILRLPVPNRVDVGISDERWTGKDSEGSSRVVLRVLPRDLSLGTEYNQENHQDIRCSSRNWSWAPSEHKRTALTQLLPDRHNPLSFQESNSYFLIIQPVVFSLC